MPASTAPRSAATALAVATFLLAVSPAQAQFGMGSGRRGGMRPDAGLPRQGGAPTVSASSALYDARIRLAIAPEQAAAWDAFYRAYLAWAGVAASGRMAADTGSAVQAADQLVARSQTRFAAEQALGQAVKGLVAVLSESQQQAADSLLPHLLALETPLGDRITAR